MSEGNTLLYVCCPKCGRPLVVTVDQDAKVMVGLVQHTPPPI